MNNSPKKKVCPKCGYMRSDTDTAPDYECPKCGIVYSKIGAPAPAPREIATPVSRNIGEDGGKLKYVVFAVVVVGLGGWYFTRGHRSAPPPPPPAVAKAATPAPPVEPTYDSATDYAKAKVSIALDEVSGSNIRARVVNNGNKDLNVITVRITGYKRWIPDSRFIKEDEPREEADLDLPNSPFPAAQIKETVIAFPKGIQTIIGASVQAAMY